MSINNLPEQLRQLDMPAHWAGIVPTGRYFSLIAAALALGDPRQCWQEYIDRLGTATPDDGEVRLFPFVAARLEAALATAPRAAWLMASRRVAIARSMATIHTASLLARHLDDAAIPFMFLKGQALVARVYRRTDLRRAADIDLYVPEVHAGDLFALAAASGWSIKGLHRQPRPQMFAAIGETTFVTPGGDEIDVHWRPRRSFAWLPDWTERFADSRHKVAWRDRHWPIPSDTWLLIETIEHGLKCNAVCPIRWVVDAYSLLSCPDVKIDWETVLAAASAARVRPAFRLGLNILSALGAPVPDDVLARLHKAPGRLERTLFAWRMRRHSTAMTLVEEVMHYLLRGPGQPLDRLIVLPHYIRKDSFEYLQWRDLWWRLRHGSRRAGVSSPLAVPAAQRPD